MGNTYIVDENEYIIDDERSLIVTTKADDYEYNEVFYKHNESIIEIGSYSLFNYGHSTDYLVYSDRYVAIRSEAKSYKDYSVTISAFFDMKNDQFIDSDQGTLLNMFNNIFKEGPVEKFLHDGVYSVLKNPERIDLREKKESIVPEGESFFSSDFEVAYEDGKKLVRRKNNV